MVPLLEAPSLITVILDRIFLGQILSHRDLRVSIYVFEVGKPAVFWQTQSCFSLLWGGMEDLGGLG